MPPFKTAERGSDWNDFAASTGHETFMHKKMGQVRLAWFCK